MSDEYRFLTREERRTTWQYIFWIIGVLVFSSLIGWGVSWLLLPTKVINPDEGLVAWRWFYDTREALNATAANIENATKSVQDFRDFNGSPSGWDFQQNGEYQRLVTVRDGYIAHYNALASQYNAKMKDFTRNWSAPPDLPRRIDSWDSG